MRFSQIVKKTTRKAYHCFLFKWKDVYLSIYPFTCIRSQISVFILQMMHNWAQMLFTFRRQCCLSILSSLLRPTAHPCVLYSGVGAAHIWYRIHSLPMYIAPSFACFPRIDSTTLGSHILFWDFGTQRALMLLKHSIVELPEKPCKQIF